ncbi:D-amino-acid transaminase [Enterococcus sp. 8G7_MSG3316]|uniref:D-alanine aminotransferase n=1 Tax=Candidatus Enterococcus testudinis TaxID=1834191 RepID=A0A242A6N7_9ENTE|nr:D-amino-acid transaminase [Enterococcus sp. 8G7_MSG3316]OTN76579.1 D-amino-acid transaminase [Enterococcus sp. 8G7_MSG3316]
MKVLWNEHIVDRDQVKLDIEDRGYQYGDGIYEVIRVYHGQCYMLEEHMQRLTASAKKIKLALPYDVTLLKEQLKALIAVEKIDNGEVYLQITRGMYSPRNHQFPPVGTVTPVLTANAIPFERPTDMQERGLTATVIPDQRWLHCDIKSLSLLGNLLSLDEAIEKGFDDALLQRDGYFTEASASNVWFVIDGQLYTHPDGPLVLPGITKIKVRALCAELGISLHEEPVAISQLPQIQECFLTNSVWEIVPVVSIDGQMVGAGDRGPITTRLQQAYIDAI